MPDGLCKAEHNRKMICSHQRWVSIVLEKKKKKKGGKKLGQRDCIAACVAEIALEAALTGWQQ